MNFIFFMPDELRAESVGCYGHPLVQTPNIDTLAAQGTRFEQCHVQHSVCTPSRCSLMTGWYPHVRGHRTLWHMLRPDEPNLLRYLKQAGYAVHWYGKNDLLATESFASSVDVAQRRGSGLFGPNPFAVDDPRYYSFLYEPYNGPLEQHGDYANVQAGIEFLRSRPKEPFVLYLPLTLPHCPYSAPQPWHDLVNPDDLPPLRPANLPNRPDFHALIRRYRRLDQLERAMHDALLRKIQAVYLGMTALIDDLLGQLLETLEETGLADSTTVSFFSDHGDYAGDYGLVEKWPSAGEDVITRVPLIVRTPGGKAGHVVHEPVELFDLMATTLEQAGIAAQHSHFAVSYADQLQGAAGNAERAAFTEGGYARHEPHAFEGKPSRDKFARTASHIYYPKGQQQQDFPDSVGRVVAMRTATHRLVYRPTGQNELYDLCSDPQELTNCYGNPAYHAVRQQLERRLLDWLVQTSDVTPFAVDERGFPTA
ncbi:MAG: sulfatase-like hydrolase/transferase [Caldilineaceae bacterium]|nr:sulfatase-like hydrolase/transferase [Caldilineaceae bacterium]